MKTVKHLISLIFVMAVSIIFWSCSKSGAGAVKPKSNTDSVSTFAGTGSSGAANGTGVSASFTYPSAIVYGGNSQLVIGDFGNNLIRTINASSAAVTTTAGTGTQGLLNGVAASAEFYG